MQFITDFADQALLLPSAVAITAVLVLLGSWRGVVAWVLVVVASYGLVASMKLGFAACGSPLPNGLLRSPSGHTMAATVIYGGVLVLLGVGRWTVLAVSCAIAALIGSSRVELGDHTGVEVLVGSAIGIAGVVALQRLASPLRPRRGGHALGGALLLLALFAPALLLHGHRSPAESLLRQMGREYVGPLLGCSADPDQ